jgi:hypothetical protein
VGHVLPNLSLTTLAQRFQRFAQRECHVSPLYARLALGIAEDPEVLAIAAPARPGQPRPNLFLAAVHFLLLQGVSHPLAGFYPSLAAAPAPTADPYPSFRAFCLGHAEALRQLIATRLVQTNEVRRCACLLPGFALVARRGKHRPLALVEIGASAGLNLLWDRYGYEYSAGRRCGDENSPVQLSCSVRRKACPPLPTAWPAVASRVGLELNPLDVRDADAVLWLRALLWPDEAGRAEMLAGAVHIAQQAPPRLLGGDPRGAHALRLPYAHPQPALAAGAQPAVDAPRRACGEPRPVPAFHRMAGHRTSPAGVERLRAWTAHGAAARPLRQPRGMAGVA